MVAGAIELTLVTPMTRETRMLAKPLLFGFLPADMAQGCTVYAAGAVNPLTAGRGVYSCPALLSLRGKGRR